MDKENELKLKEAKLNHLEQRLEKERLKLKENDSQLGNLVKTPEMKRLEQTIKDKEELIAELELENRDLAN